MQRTRSSTSRPGTAPLFALAVTVAAGLASNGCWGESFSSLEAPTSGAGGMPITAGVTGATTGTASTVGNAATTGTTGGVVGSTTAETLSTTSMGGGTGTVTGTSTTSALSSSPLGDNCQQLRLPANRDILIWGMSPDDNYDFRGLGEDLLEVWQYGSSSKRVLLRFEIYLNTPAEWTVAAAYLELQALLVDSYGGRLNLHRMQKDWEERVANWNVATTNQPWSTPGGDFESEPFSGLDFTPAMQETIAVWDVTTEVQRVHAGGENYGWMLKEAGEPAEGNLLKYAFPGRDTQDAAQVVPTLAIHFCN